MAIDPVLSQRILSAGRRFTPPGLDRLPPLDLLLISHNHYDHLDAPTVRTLSQSTTVVVPARLGRWFRRRGFRSVTELDWWEPVPARRGDVRAGASLEPARRFRPLRHPMGWLGADRARWPVCLPRVLRRDRLALSRN